VLPSLVMADISKIWRLYVSAKQLIGLLWSIAKDHFYINRLGETTLN